MNKNIRLILFVSLAINFVLIGLITGHFLNKPKKHHKHQKSISYVLKGKIADDKLAVLEESMENNRAKNKDARSEVQETHKKLEEIMTAEKFDASAFEAKLKDLNSLHSAKFNSMGKTLLQILPTLTKEERVALSNFLEKNRPKHGKGQGRPPPPRN